MNFNNCLKVATSLLQRQSLRSYAFKSDLKIKWVRPEKIPSIKPQKSGDLAPLKPVNPDTLLVNFEKSEELKSADPAVQSLFQLKNNRNTDITHMHKTLMIREVQRHSLDFGSMETKIAKMTASIRRNQEYMEKFPRDKRRKVILKEMIDKRKKFLKYLRRWDYRRFEWLLEKLDIVYKPEPTDYSPVTRKKSLQKLTDIYCENIKKERLDAYYRKLEEEKVPILEEKLKTLTLKRNEELVSKADEVTVTEEEINAIKQELDAIKAKRAEEEELKKQGKPQNEAE